jgi:hypothetical protein
MRVLLALEEAARREEVASAFERHRLHFWVRSVDPQLMTLEAVRFQPHLVVCEAAAGPLVAPTARARVHLFTHGGVPVAVVQVGQSYRWMENIGVEDLLAIAEEVEEKVFGEGQQPNQRSLSVQRFQTIP